MLSGIWSVVTTRFTSELESNLWDTVHWGKKWLVYFNAGKTQLSSFHRSNNTGGTDEKLDGSVLEEKSTFKMLGLNFCSKLDGPLTLPPSLKLSSIKLEPWFGPWSFFPLRSICISINAPYDHAWDNVVMSELVLPVVTWSC